MPRSGTFWSKLGREESFALTTDRKLATDEIAFASATHPIVNLLMHEADESLLTIQLQAYLTDLPASESLEVVLVHYRLRDDNGNLIENRLRLFGERGNGQFIEISPHWLYSDLEAKFTDAPTGSSTLLLAAKRQILLEQQAIRTQRKLRGFQIQEQLEAAFSPKINTLKDRLAKYQEDNENHKNSALINKTASDIREQQGRREERLAKAEREATVSLQKLEVLCSLIVPADPACWRQIPEDAEMIIELYEEQAGRNLTRLPAFGLADFITEDAEGNVCYLLTSHLIPDKMDYLEDYSEIINDCYIYVINGFLVETVLPMTSFM